MHKVPLVGIAGLLVSSVISPDTRSANIKVNSNVVGPYEKFANDSVMTIDYSIGKDALQMWEEISVLNPKTGTEYYRTTYEYHEVYRNINNHLEFNLKLSRYFGNDGIKIKIRIIYGKSTTYYSNSVSIYPITKNVYFVTRDDINRIQSEHNSFQIVNSNIITSEDDFNFSNLKSFFDSDIYYYLDLKEISFLYNSDQLPYEKITLSIPDEECSFKYLKHSSDDIIYLPLEIENNGENKYFKFKNDLYVNQNNLQISDSKITNFVKTEKLYLPINQKEKLVGANIQICIYECGINKYNLVFDLTYDAYRSLIGNCNNSDYCIKGEIL